MSLLYTHSKELNASLNELKEGTSNTDWILFGYEGDDLTLVSSGSNGLEEIKDEFDEECVQYALLKIFDETSKMLRFIYIAWCGEYAPPFQKANFSQHSQIVENFFKGYHVKINARCYEDVEPENIISKVQNSSFINFSSKSAPVPLKKPVFNLPNKPANPALKNLPTPSQLSQMKPTQTFYFEAKKPEPTPTPKPTPTTTTSAPAPAPGPRPNPLAPRTNPLAPRANPLAPKANPLSPKNNFANISKPAAPAPAPVTAKPVVAAPAPTSKSTPSVGFNPLNPRRNPLAPAKSNQLNRNNPTTEQAQSSQSEKVTIKPITPVGPPRVNISTNAFEGIVLPDSEPAVENEGIDTSSRDSVANVRKMFEKKPEKKINNVMLKSQLFSNNNNEHASRVREERLRREKEDNALLEREKLANKQRELQEEIGKTGKTTTTEPTPLKSSSSPFNSPKPTQTSLPKYNPLNINRANPLNPPKTNPLNANKTNPLRATKVNSLNPSSSAPSLPPRDAAPSLPPRNNPLNSAPSLPPRENPSSSAPSLPPRENPLAPPALPARDAAPVLPTRSNPLAPPPIPQRVLNSNSKEKEEEERKEREERERKEREERERKEREERERREREEKEREEREERERKEREEQEKLKTRTRAVSTGNGEYAIVTYDYEPGEDNEIALVEGEIIKNIVQIDEGWWQGENSKGEVGLFPSNYVELKASDSAAAPAPIENTKSAIALYDYEAQEENEISFKEGDVITNLNFVTDDWWEGVVNGECGLFPGNFVQVNQ